MTPKRLAAQDDLRSVDEMEAWVGEDMRDAYRRVDRICEALEAIGVEVPDGSDDLNTLDKLSQTAMMFKEFPEGRGSTCFSYKDCELLMSYLDKLAEEVAHERL